MMGIRVWGKKLEPRQFCQKYARLKEDEEGYESGGAKFASPLSG